MPKRTRSLGPDIVAFGLEHGVELDAWQADALDVFSGVRGRGKKWAAGTCYLLCPRQNGKSTILVLRALYGLFCLNRRMILFSSHQWASSNENFLQAKAIIEASPELAGQVKSTRLSAAMLGFELHSGARILFLTRSRAAARGFSGDEIYFDESHFLNEAAHAAIRPTLGGRSAAGNVQVFYASSAVDQMRHPDGVVASRLRKRGIEGADGIAFIEYSAGLEDEDGRELLPVEVPAAACVDPDVLQRANPACPARLSLAFLLDEAATLDVASHAVEHMGCGDWFDEDAAGQTQLDLARWAELADAYVKPAVPFSIGFDVSRDRRQAAVALAGHDGENVILSLDTVAAGVDWIPGRLEELGASSSEDAYESVWSSADTVVCDSYQAQLAEQVRQVTGITCDMLDRARVAQACAGLVDRVHEGTLRHDGNPLLTDALKAATVTSVGDAGWAFSRRTSSADLSPLYAAVFALAGVRVDSSALAPVIY